MPGTPDSARVKWSVATGRAESDFESLEARWRTSLETAGNLLCHLPADVMSTVRVILPLNGRPEAAERLEALAQRLADERELRFESRQGAHSVRITFSNRM